MCRYNNSIHHRRAGVGKQRFVNDSGSLAVQIPPISLTGNTSVPSSPGAAQPEELDPRPSCQHGPCHSTVHQPGCTWELMEGKALTTWPLPVNTLRAAGALRLGMLVPQPWYLSHERWSEAGCCGQCTRSSQGDPSAASRRLWELCTWTPPGSCVPLWKCYPR